MSIGIFDIDDLSAINLMGIISYEKLDVKLIIADSVQGVVDRVCEEAMGENWGRGRGLIRRGIGCPMVVCG